MAGIECDGQHACGVRLCLRLLDLVGLRGLGGLGCRRCTVPLATADQGGDRIRRIGRIEIEHQPVLVLAHRCERKDLRVDLFLQIEHQAHHARTVLGDAYLMDVGIVRLDLGDQLLERRVQLQSFDVDDQALRIPDDEMSGLQADVAFQRHARVVLRGPGAHGQNL